MSGLGNAPPNTSASWKTRLTSWGSIDTNVKTPTQLQQLVPLDHANVNTNATASAPKAAPVLAWLRLLRREARLVP